MSHCHNHHTYHSNTKIVRRNFLSWELRLHQMKITGCEPTIIVSLAIANSMAIQKDRATIFHLDRYSHDEDEIWQMANTKVESVMPSKILEIKNNPPEPVNIILVSNPDAFFNIETNPEDFHEHYQNLALTRKEQEEWLAQLNT
ncbi:hypothetical protein G9A89_010176 [Geosiphon pyriformis]|nr:hypothetical protein G9A89_010176 [Geosiphon pyriformis]